MKDLPSGLLPLRNLESEAHELAMVMRDWSGSDRWVVSSVGQLRFNRGSTNALYSRLPFSPNATSALCRSHAMYTCGWSKMLNVALRSGRCLANDLMSLETRQLKIRLFEILN